MEAFLDTIADQVREALHERSDDILKAWHENIEEAQENAKDFPPLKVAMSAAVDIEAARIETSISFTAKYQTKLSAPLPDPNQPELPGVES
ncbi:hypothetical protein HNR46_001615 [Haloferula luteola]|uniref:Uncharacterized protein n=1 Tax=Haloferula luteola TaxID=595692 RepID=A0A840VC42_9BACT|nr:hypothetical protein [Haloferula luteola]MBB5351379.1 hypothetical protein [Haloferula luteola]